VEIELLESTADVATVRITSTEHGMSEQVAMTRVEGRWVPTAMAQQWSMVMSRARAAIERLPAMSDASTKARAKAELGRLEDQLDAIESATDARQLGSAMRMGRAAARPR
jgi:hypothetical protein